MKINYFFYPVLRQWQVQEQRARSHTLSVVKFFLSFGLILFMSISLGHAQKGQGTKDIVIRSCSEYIGNGLYEVSFSYENPNKKEVIISEENSYVVSNKRKGKMKGVNSFKPGRLDKAFTKVINEHEEVHWIVLNPNGKTHEVFASANSSHCPDEYSGSIFPLFGQGSGKEINQLGVELQALIDGTAGDDPTDIVFQINDENEILLELVPRDGKLADLIGLLQVTFDRVHSADPKLTDFLVDPSTMIAEDFQAVDLYFPIPRLFELNDHSDVVNFARPIYPAYQNGKRYDVISQGDASQKSDLIKESFRLERDGNVVEVDGSGIKIGVISNSFDTQPYVNISKATNDVNSGELPGVGNQQGYNIPVDVVQDFAYGIASDEGRAMLQIIHDVAPGAELAFHSGVISPREFELAIKALDLAGCSILTDDITFPGEPFFGEGKVSEAIRAFTSKPGHLYFTSAGNFADNAYASVFNSSNNTPDTYFIPAGSGARAHVYGTKADGSPDMTQRISVEPGTYFIALQWDESLASHENSTGAVTDLDIYLVDAEGRMIVGNNRINDLGDPTEFMVFMATEASEAEIMIVSNNGPPPPGLAFRYIAFRSDGLDFLEYNKAPTVSGHAMTKEAITIGAIDYLLAENPSVEFFSSLGGNLPDASFAEVDLCAPDGGNINMESIGFDRNEDEDQHHNFFGTSAAAPHAAGAFALLMSALPSWFPEGLPAEIYGDKPLSEQVVDLFKAHALPAGPAELAGAGLIQADKVFNSLAAQTARITDLQVEGGVPGRDLITLKVIGDFFPEDPILFFGEDTLSIESMNDNMIVAKVDPFTGNPPVKVFTHPKTPGGTDGAYSDPAYILDEGKISINIVTRETQLEYGQDLSFSYLIEGAPAGHETTSSLGLPEVEYALDNIGLPYPDVDSYLIYPKFDVPLDSSQQAKFQVNFIPGRLSLERKNLVITPKDAEFVYGDPILIEKMYSYDPTGISNNEDFLQRIEQAHSGDYYRTNSLIQLNDYRIKLKGAVNEQAFLDSLAGSSWIVSELTSKTKLRGVVNSMAVLDLEVQHMYDYFGAISNALSTKYKIKAEVNQSGNRTGSKLSCVVNGFDLFSDRVEMSIENATVPKVKAVVNETGVEADSTTLSNQSKIFAVIDFDDGAGEGEENVVSAMYAMDMITGYDVTVDEDDLHYIHPGGFISAMSSNFNLSYGVGRLRILPAVLTVSTPDYLIHREEDVNEAEVDSLTSITGFVYEETRDTVYPEGTTFYYKTDAGTPLGDPKEPGVYNIMLSEPRNYVIEYDEIGQLFVNPYGNNLKKVRSYLDCIEDNPTSGDGLNYIANFRYYNPNSETIYVLHGEDNFMSGSARFEGQPPTVFLPGEGVFQIPFDGQKLIWNLSTFDSTHKSSVSSEATDESGKCEAKDVDPAGENQEFKLYPNPFETSFTVERYINENGSIQIYDIYGVAIGSPIAFSKNDTNLMTIDLSAHPDGWYLVRITTVSGTYTFTMMKQ